MLPLVIDSAWQPASLRYGASRQLGLASAGCRLMARIGRRPGFWLGTAIGGVGAVIATWAIFRSSFEWF